MVKTNNPTVLARRAILRTYFGHRPELHGLIEQGRAEVEEVKDGWAVTADGQELVVVKSSTMANGIAVAIRTQGPQETWGYIGKR